MQARLFTVALIATMFTSSALAASQAIIATPQETTGPFQHNVFHSASSNGGGSGSILAWFDLDGASTSTWDPDTGALTLHINIFSDSALTTQVGTALGTSSSLLGANMSAPGLQDGGLIGSIAWDFDAAAESISGLVDTTMAFIDHDYITSSAGFNANSQDGNFVTLWGADGGYNVNSGVFMDSDLGMDMTFQVVPIPAAVWLFGSGLIGLFGFARRKVMA